VELPFRLLTSGEEIRKTFGLWGDDISRREYIGQLLWQTSLDPSVLPPHLPQSEIYFAADLFAPLANEVFVDCGAFNGDSVQEFIKRRAGIYEQIIAIEPDPANCGALEGWLATLPLETSGRIQVIQNALGSNRERITFNATGTAGSSVGKGNYQVESAPLDELLDGFRPTLMKMDIEGAEPDALLGAKKILMEDAPVLAICLYHVQEHLWQIPLLIHSISDQYDLFLRRYADECWEIVCYAVPKTRLIA
jgi:FkbM family methyltransferase